MVLTRRMTTAHNPAEDVASKLQAAHGVGTRLNVARRAPCSVAAAIRRPGLQLVSALRHDCGRDKRRPRDRRRRRIRADAGSRRKEGAVVLGRVCAKPSVDSILPDEHVSGRNKQENRAHPASTYLHALATPCTPDRVQTAARNDSAGLTSRSTSSSMPNRYAWPRCVCSPRHRSSSRARLSRVRTYPSRSMRCLHLVHTPRGSSNAWCKVAELRSPPHPPSPALPWTLRTRAPGL